MSPNVGPLIADEVDVEAGDDTFGVDRRSHDVTLVAGVVGRHQMLLPVLDPLHGPSQSLRR